jgi:hypothetical protein
MAAKLFTKKQWLKHKAKHALRLEEAVDAARLDGMRVQQEQDYEELAGVLFSLLARNPGQVTATLEADKSVFDMAFLKRRERGDIITYEVYLKNLEP